MKNVSRIFFSDLRSIGRSFFAIVITLAVLIIPALYAWVNIYANGDPYANTGNVPIALAYRDRGYTTEEGERVNEGRTIIEEIAKSESINWIIVEDPEEAVEGVRAGRYYGALVMNEHLSRNMHDMTAALKDGEPSIIFYQNAKTNAIANKISATAASTAEHNIQVQYLSVLIENILAEVRDLLGQIADEDNIDALIQMLTDLRDSLREYSRAVSSMKIMDGDLLDRLDQAAQNLNGVGISDGAFDTVEEARQLISQVRDSAINRVDEVQRYLTELSEKIDGLMGQSVPAESLPQLIELTGKIESALQALRESMPDSGNVPGLEVAVRAMDAMLQRVRSLEEELQLLYENGGTFTDSMLQGYKDLVNAMQSILSDNLRPGLELMFDSLLEDVELLYKIMGSINTTIADIPPVISSAKGALGALQGTMYQLKTFLDNAANATDKLLQKVIFLKESGLLNELIELFNGDPKQMAEFLAQPVQVTTEVIYPVANYGTAMTPFYSTLAIWVGGVVLGAIFKAEAEGRGLRRVRERQLFWGRYLLFFFFGQIQAAVIIWGDLHLLGCQCAEPGLLYLCAAVTSFVFISLIYSLILAFGDVGKAIVVVVMILQIAGSSGSYPIEILPPIFSRIYLFFPFPYAINAMREAICGLYQYDIFKFLLELSVFGILGLLIGLVVRKPFVGVTHFIEEDMERTGVL